MDIREAVPGDLMPLLALYTHLHEQEIPTADARLKGVWRQMMSDPNHHILVGEEGGEPVASCVVVIVPNLTRGQRPYALVENVVTHSAHRKKGYGSLLLAKAEALARGENCYKIMLLTGSREEGAFRFYRQAGYNSEDKTAFIRWL